MPDLQSLVARHMGRPVLMLPKAAEEIALRIWRAEPGAFRTGGIFSRFLAFAGRAKPQAWDDDGPEREPLPPGGYAYCPRWMEDAGGPDDDLGLGMSLKDGIACLNIDTALSAHGREICGHWHHGYDTIAAALQMAFADARVRGIFIRFDTPGGVVDDGIDAVAEVLRANRETAGGKPVWGFCDMAASAGYWIAAQCDRLIAPKTGLVGSIGAVIVHWEYAGALKADGITVTPIQFGAQKTAGAPFQELSETARSDMQAWVDQAGRDFVAAISAGREALSAEACLATEARLYTAHHDEDERSGLALGLVDDLMREPAAFAALVQHTEQAVPGSPAAASAGTAPAPTAKKETDMAKSKAAAASGRSGKPVSKAARLAARRKAAEARLAAIRAEEEEEALEEEEETGAEDDDAPKGEDDDAPKGEDDDEPKGEGDDEPKGEDDDEPKGEDDDEPKGEDDDEDSPAARKAARAEERRLAIMGLAEARGAEAMARSLAAKGFTVKQAKAALIAAKRTGALAARRDTPVRGGSETGAATDKTSARLKAAVAELKQRREARGNRR